MFLFTPATNRLLVLSGFYFLLFLSFRIAFFAIYVLPEENSSYREVALGFLLGIRFDLSSIGMALGPFLLASQISFLHRFRLYPIVWATIPFLLLPLVFGLGMADLIYFAHGGKRIGYEAFAFLGKDFFSLVSWFWSNSPLLAFFSFFFVVLLWIGSLFFLEMVFRKGLEMPYRGWKKDLISFFIYSFVIIILIRGGWQASPLRASSAIISNSNALNFLALNPVFTAITDTKRVSLAISEQMELLAAIPIVQSEISYPGASFIDPIYPLLRKTDPSLIKQINSRTNLVLVLLESWTGKYANPLTPAMVSHRTVTPNFHAMAREGVFFPNFFATGGRTTNGLMASLVGVPDKPGLTVLRTPLAMQRFSGIASIVRQADYKTVFITGGDLSFDNLQEVLPRWGFEELWGEEEFVVKRQSPRGEGGVDDEHLWEFLHSKLLETQTKNGPPLFATLLTLTSHYPYKPPRKEFEIFSEKDSEEFAYLNSLLYADWALSEFFKKAKQSSYFKNTVFVFVGDHTHHRSLNYFEDRNIPFLVYAPMFHKPEVRLDIASQLDIVPTLVGYLPKSVNFTAMGKDLFRAKSNSAFFAYGAGFGWIEDNVFLFQSVDGKLGFPFTVKAPLGINPLCQKLPKACEPYLWKARAFLNVGLELLNQNLIYPP